MNEEGFIYRKILGYYASHYLCAEIITYVILYSNLLFILIVCSQIRIFTIILLECPKFMMSH